MPYKDPEAKRAYNRAYQQAHKEALKAGNRANTARYRRAHPDRVLAYRLAYEASHREQILAAKRARHAANKERLNAESRAYHRAHAAAINARHTRWRAQTKVKVARAATAARWWLVNKTRALARHQAWCQANPDRIAIKNSRYRARKISAPVTDLSPQQWLEIKAAYDYRCVYCPPDCHACQQRSHALTQDHLTPLSKGGSDTASNVVPACKSCNSRKHNGPPRTPVQPLLFTIAPARKT